MLVIQLIWQEVFKLCRSQRVQDHSVMVTRLYLSVTILAISAITVAHGGIYSFPNPFTNIFCCVVCCVFRGCDISFADINIRCLKDSVSVTWNITADLVPYAGRLFLGTCVPSKFQVLPTGEGEAQFNYPLTSCKFVKRVMKMLNVGHSSIISISFTHFSADEGKIHPI